jgi:hypothetical protein
MQRSVAVLSCKLCGRPYFPGERIEIIGLDDESAVAHVECMEHAARELMATLDFPREAADCALPTIRNLVDSA